LPDGFELERRVVNGHERSVFKNARASFYLQLRDTAERTPKAVAVVDNEGRKYTYADLLEKVDRFAGYLQEICGVIPGDKIGLLMQTTVEYIVALYAINRIGAITVVLSTKMKERELEPLLEMVEVKFLVCDEESLPQDGVFPISPDKLIYSFDSREKYGFDALGLEDYDSTLWADEEDVALMMFTSGTTSQSKAVLLTNSNVVHASMAYAALTEITPKDKTIVSLPIYYVTGLVALVMQFIYIGATLYLHRRFDAERTLRCIAENQITYMHGAPAAFVKMQKLQGRHPSLPSLEIILSGSSRETENNLRAYHTWLPACTYQVVYGLTETASPALLFPGHTFTSEYRTATGYPVPGVDAKIVGDDGEEVAPGETGELWLRGTCVTNGYYNLDSPAVHEDGWFQTGDLAYMNEKGLVWIVDRIKDMIDRGGEKIWCSSVEAAICEIDGVKECCVSHIPDQLYGELPVAVVVCDGTANVDEAYVKANLKDRLARYEIPEHIVVVDEIPLTPASKPDKKAVAHLVLDSMWG
jgi:fatty-acyl-CoA synthase/long-chain acyl-CoA synthetase